MIPVALARCAEYDPDLLAPLATNLLASAGFVPSPGLRVLVKPNLLRPDPKKLVCTHARLIAAVCRCLLEHGCRVSIGDSPGFGSAPGVARSIGLPEALSAVPGGKDISVLTLGAPVLRPLSLGGSVSLSRHALEADHILNLPKLKAHSQMRMTGAVKNLFGCVPGVRKAVLHARHGDKAKDGTACFSALIADIMAHLPPMTSLLDGVSAMHVTGPSNGRPYGAHLLAASSSPVALDTAVYTLMGLSPGQVPLWRELQRRAAPGAFAGDIEMAGESPEFFDFSGFVLPQSLTAESFNPFRLLRSTIRRLWAGFRR